MKLVYADKALYASVYVDAEGAHFLYTLCTNVGWFRYCVRMNERETRAFTESPSYAGELAGQICRDWSSFADRQMSDEFSKQHGFDFS